MHFTIRSTGKPLRSWLALLAFGSFFAIAAPAQAQIPQTTYTVGNIFSDIDCDYLTVRQALEVAATQIGGSVTIKVAVAKDISLGYSWINTNSAFELTNPKADIGIFGGYASCGASFPANGEYTRLTYTSNVDDDAGHTMLAISNASSHVLRSLSLFNIRMEGASDSSAGGPTFGGALKATGNVLVSLTNSRVSGFHATAGGGISLLGSGTDPSRFPKLTLKSGSEVSANTANSGGGIYSLFGRVKMNGASVFNNSARLDGGGIYLVDHEDNGDASSDSHFALVLESFGPINNIGANHAGTTTFSGTSGRGGGVYSLNGQILAKPVSGSPRFQTYFFANEANLGGGIFVEGPNQSNSGVPFTYVRLNNTSFSDNSSRGQGGALYLKNHVATLIDSAGGHCEAGSVTLHPGPCSYFGGNMARGSDGHADIPRGGAIYVTDSSPTGTSRASINVYRTWFDGNKDPNGLAAVAASSGTSDFLFYRNIFTHNGAKNTGGAASVLIHSNTTRDLTFYSNTVLDSNTSTRMFYMYGGTIDVSNSILWGTVDRTHPFHFVWFDEGGADMVNNACLLVRDSDGGTAGIPYLANVWAGHAPDLDNAFAPRGSSAAIDQCQHDFFDNPVDAYGQAVYDVPGVTQRYGNYDVGAVEQADVIFANSFGVRPGN